MKISRDKFGEALRWGALVLAAGLVLATPFPTGSQAEYVKWIVAIVACLLGAMALLYSGLAARTSARDPVRGTYWQRMLARAERIDPVLASASFLCIWILLQLVPLPVSLVGLVSPERVRLAEAVASATGERVGPRLALSVCLKCTRDEFLFLAACLGVFAASSRLLRRDGPLHVVMAAMATAGGGMALLGFWKLHTGTGLRLFSTYTSANRLAGLLAIAAASGAGLYLMARGRALGSAPIADAGGRRKKGADGPGAPPPRPWAAVPDAILRLKDLWLSLAAVSALALVLTLSRLGIASAIMGALLSLAVFTRRRAFLAGLVGVLVVVALGALLAADPVLERYSLLFEKGATGSGRLPCWRMALGLAADFFVTGSGGGTFRHTFALYQEPTLGGWWKFAHNDYLNILTDCGVVGLVAAVGAAGFLVRRILGLRHSGDATTRAVGFAAFLALSILLVHSLGDYPLRQPANAIALAVLVGIADGRARKRAASRRDSSPSPATPDEGHSQSTHHAPAWRMWACVVLALALVLAFVPLLVRLRLSASSRARAEAFSPGPDQALSRECLERRARLLERAARFDAWDAEVRYEAARALSALAWGRYENATGPLPEDEGLPLLLRAGRLLREARRASPLDPRAHYLAAFMEFSRGRVGSADSLMALASRFGPAWPDVAFNSGKYFLMRWAGVGRTDAEFGLHRWQRGPDAERDELFGRLSRGMALAVRSPSLKSSVIAMLLDHGLSSREIDAVLEPNADMHLALAGALARRGRHGPACDRFARALASEGFVPAARTHAAYGASLANAGETARALERFALALDSSTRPAGVAGSFREVARAIAGLRLPPESGADLLAFWRRMRDKYPDQAEVTRGLALAELAGGDGEAAFGHFLEYAKATQSADGWAELARVGRDLGRLQIAATFAARAIELDPRRVPHLLLHAHILGRLEDAEGEGTALRSVLALEPEHAGAARGLARLETAAARYEAAAGIWRAFLAAGGDRATGHEGLADVHLALLDMESARAQLLKALDAKPDDKRLKARLEALSQ